MQMNAFVKEDEETIFKTTKLRQNKQNPHIRGRVRAANEIDHLIQQTLLLNSSNTTESSNCTNDEHGYTHSANPGPCLEAQRARLPSARSINTNELQTTTSSAVIERHELNVQPN